MKGINQYHIVVVVVVVDNDDEIVIGWQGTDNPAPSHPTLQTRDQSNPVSLYLYSIEDGKGRVDDDDDDEELKIVIG